MTTGMGQSYSYDGANRLKEVGTGGANVYGYDGDGKRVKKTEGGTTTYYVYSSKLGQAVMEVTANSVQRAYVYGGGKLVAMQATDGQFYWLHTNHLGNSRAMTDASGNLTYKGQFDPYGAALTEWSGSGNTNLNSKKFTGYERDSATGLDYANARMYNSSRGRFMTPDPIGLRGANHKIPQSLNRYSYVQNDPVNATDPTGEFLSYCGWGIWEQIVFGIASSGICRGGWWGANDWRELYAKAAPEGGRGGGDTQSIPTCTELMGTLGLELKSEESDDGLLARLIYIETGWGTSMENNGKAMAALAATVFNRRDFLNQPGLQQHQTAGFGSVGASLRDVMLSNGKNPNGVSDMAVAYQGFSPTGIDQALKNRITRTLNRSSLEPECAKMIAAIGYASTAMALGSGIDPYGGKSFGVRTQGAGAPAGQGWYKLGDLAGQSFYGWSGWR